MYNACRRYRLVYGLWGWCRRGLVLVPGGTDILACYSEVSLSYLDGLRGCLRTRLDVRPGHMVKKPASTALYQVSTTELKQAR